MKILIATGIYPPDIGGPANYAKSLNDEFVKLGYSVKVLSYKFEKRLPIVVRHFWFFMKMILSLKGVNFIIALDTFSVGLPTVLVGILLGKKVIIRTGGDFLWESYIARTKEKIFLSEFYKKERKYSVKEKIIFKLTKFLLKNADSVVFSTDWQRRIFIDAYGLNKEKIFIVENFYGSKIKNFEPKEKNFLWSGRDIPLKNLDILKKAFKEARKVDSSIKLDISEKVPRSKLIEKIKKCYAIILPSISEVSPNFVLEALMLNRPFIVTKDTGLYDKLKEVGSFINPIDSEEIKEKILFLANDDNYNKVKNKVSSFLFTHSYNEIVLEFLEIYKKI